MGWAGHFPGMSGAGYGMFWAVHGIVMDWLGCSRHGLGMNFPLPVLVMG